MLRLLIIFCLLLPLTSHGQIVDSRLPISLDADFSDYDGKNSMLTFKGLRLSQGNISIEADEGRASKLDFENSVWRLSGNVSITVGEGRIECATANLEFDDNRLTVANITGDPATFELRRSGSDETTYAQAGRLRYDLTAGSIEFLDEATIVEGGNQIASEYLVYSIADQRIKAQGSDEENGKVKITFTPRNTEAADGSDPAAGEQPGDGAGDTPDEAGSGDPAP